jgi:tetratricopeptide (TPR) repeat protein
MDKETLINSYFENSLSKDQLKEFEQLMKTDSEFASEVDFQKELQHSFKKNERQEIKQMLGDLNIVENDTETKVFSIRPWLAAASIALLVGVGTWMLFFTNTDINTNQLYASNFAPYDNVVHPIERGNAMINIKDKAFTAYEDGDYSMALILFKQLQIEQTDPYITFYEAIVLMQLNNHQDAIPLLKAYIENDGLLKDRATWYLALSHLKMDEIENSKTQLKKLVDLDGFKMKAASGLLEELE